MENVGFVTADKTISVCMIVRNEADLLAATLDNAWELADEIIVVDTGSDDDTVIIAEDSASGVIVGADRMHKGNARNLAMKEASGDWVITLDADEKIADPRGVRKFLQSTEADAVYIKLAYVDDAGNHTLSYSQMRMWRRGAFQYKYRAHEIPLPVNGWGKSEYTNFVWEHRPPPDRLWKSQYTLDRLVLDVKENPGDARPAYYLGRQHFYRSEWNQAIGWLKHYVDLGGYHDLGDAWYILSKCHGAQLEPKKQIRALYQACAAQPMRREWWGALATLYHERGENEIAVGILKCMLEIGIPKTTYYNAYWYGSIAPDLLARCLWKLGRYEEGQAYARSALVLEPLNERLQKNVVWFDSKRVGPQAKGADYYDRVFPMIAEDAGSIERITRLSKEVAKWIIGDVLDLGCGLGLLGNILEGVDYVGIDFSEKAVAIAEKRNINSCASFFDGDIRDGCFLDNWNCDTVVLQEVLEHLECPDQIVKNAMDHACKRIIATVPINMPDPAHVKPQWSREDITALFGECEAQQIFDTYWLIVKDIGDGVS